MKTIALASLLAVFILTTQTSCLKKQDLEDQELGPIVSSTEVADKMNETVGELDLAEMKPNEFNSLISAITIEDTQTIKRYKQDLKIRSVTNTVEKFEVNFLHSYEDYLDAGQSFSNVESVYNPNKPTENDPLILPILYYFASQSLCSEKNVTCHNLTLNVTRVGLNPNLVDSKICPDANNCTVLARKVEFDLLDGNQLNDQGRPSRNHFTFIVAPQLPFMSKVLQYCVRGLMPYGNRKVLAENCIFVNSVFSGD